MDSDRKKQTFEQWHTQNAKPNCGERQPILMYSETVSEDAETITDRGYFLTFLTPEESKSGQRMVVVYTETTVYAREADGDPGKVLHSETAVIASL